jgi:hypothetical protein
VFPVRYELNLYMLYIEVKITEGNANCNITRTNWNAINKKLYYKINEGFVSKVCSQRKQSDSGTGTIRPSR